MPIDLDAIEARANAATPGPLVVVPCGVDDLGWDIDTAAGDFPAGIRGAFGRREDAEFHAAARTDVPALVARVRALEDALTELVALKRIKDREGKTRDYQWRQPLAWDAARAALGLAPEGGA